MSESAANEKIWDAIRKNLLEEEELKEAWETEEDGFGYDSYAEYVEKRIISAMKKEVSTKEAKGLNLFANMPPAAE
ncbi:MAG: hypothetical protein QNL04_03760 [SAR324 cluster bacterium]|nr:hypothetical protein [SAR324 cluster bacterium]